MFFFPCSVLSMLGGGRKLSLFNDQCSRLKYGAVVFIAGHVGTVSKLRKNDEVRNMNVIFIR